GQAGDRVRTTVATSRRNRCQSKGSAEIKDLEAVASLKCVRHRENCSPCRGQEGPGRSVQEGGRSSATRDAERSGRVGRVTTCCRGTSSCESELLEDSQRDRTANHWGVKHQCKCRDLDRSIRFANSEPMFHICGSPPCPCVELW